MSKQLRAAFVDEHIGAFLQTRYLPQGAYGGMAPFDWAANVLQERRENLPRHAMTRQDVRNFCARHPNLLDCYIVVMAWGRQDAGPAGTRRPRTLWKESQDAILNRLQRLRMPGLSPSEAYELFHRSNEIPNLGVAFFTKLLYFFAPERSNGADRYILDQWTAKSVNLLAGRRIVRMDGPSVSRRNDGAIYEAFCQEIDALTTLLNLDHPDAPRRPEDVELMLFASGGHRTSPRHWRKHVVDNWPPKCPLEKRFSRHRVIERLHELRATLHLISCREHRNT